MRSYCYSAHGLSIQSELLLPELRQSDPIEGGPDVFVRLEPVRRFAEEPTGLKVWQSVKQQCYQLNIQGVARYLALDGREILVEPDIGAQDNEVRLFLLGSVLAALIHQRGQLILHGSAVELGKGAVIFVGPIGIGKSTTAAAFWKLGYKILADDVCAIGKDKEGRLFVYPGLAHIKLWMETAAALTLDISAARRVHRQHDKFSLSLDMNHSTDPVRLQAVCNLTNEAGEEIRLKRLSTSENFEVLLRNTYRWEFLKDLGGRELNFYQVAEIARLADIFRLNRPTDLNQIGRFVSFIAEEFG